MWSWVVVLGATALAGFSTPLGRSSLQYMRLQCCRRRASHAPPKRVMTGPRKIPA